MEQGRFENQRKVAATGFNGANKNMEDMSPNASVHMLTNSELKMMWL